MSELKQIKRHHEQQLKNMDKKLTMYQIHPDDVSWLINRVEELELKVSDWRAEVQKWQKFYKESEKSHLETKELLHFMINENKRLAKESIKYRELLSDIANLAYYKEQDGEYYENLLKQVMLFARIALKGYKND